MRDENLRDADERGLTRMKKQTFEVSRKRLEGLLFGREKSLQRIEDETNSLVPKFDVVFACVRSFICVQSVVEYA